MKDRDREQNEAPIFQVEMIIKVNGMDGIYQRILRVLVEGLTGLLSIICQHTSLCGEVPGDCFLSSVTPVFQQSQKVHPGSLRAREGRGAARPGCHHAEHPGQTEDQ